MILALWLVGQKEAYNDDDHTTL